jgi:hypothetical protein
LFSLVIERDGRTVDPFDWWQEENMSEITLYRIIFVLSVVLGIALPIITAVRVALIWAGMHGLMEDQKLQQERLFRALEKSERQQQQQTGPPPPSIVHRRDLTLPALPDEGY